MNTQDLLYGIVIFLWLSYFPISLVQVKAFVRNRKTFVNKNLTRIHNDPIINFQIMTRTSGASDVVPRGIQSIINSCNEVAFSDYSISVVTEDPKDVERISGAKVIVVPKDFQTKNGAIRKARALEYASYQRRIANNGTNPTSTWIFHMDEESVVTTHTVLSILAFIREKKGLISEGPIVYPYKVWDANRLTVLAESVRPFQCYDCVSQMAHPPAIHMHGSNMLVREDVEDSVGWDHGRTLAEDQLFGFKVYEKYGNIFGWHGGVLQEQPPLTLRDHFRQRKRWIKGTLENLKFLPAKLKAHIYLRISTFWLGFLSALGSTIMYMYLSWPTTVQVFDWMFHIPYKPPHVANVPVLTPAEIYYGLVGLLSGKLPTVTATGALQAVIGVSLIFTFVIWLIGSQVGLAYNIKDVKMTKIKRASLHIQQLLFSPFVGIVETFPALVGLIEWFVRPDKREDFHIVSK
ncbi:MAG: glycosyltransferase family 2 protein [archaeon]|nr:glycosyltransferase family 2 protein [archaeon]